MRIIRGRYGKRRFNVPKNITARPTTDFARENLFNVLECHYELDGKTALDLFAGTGAIGLEFLSRGCREVTEVETSSTQANFIRSVKDTLHAEGLKIIKGDVFRFLSSARREFDFVFADPPYDHPRFGEIPGLILSSGAVGENTLVIVEHSKNFDFSQMPEFLEKRTYGSVNFSFFSRSTDEDGSAFPLSETDKNL